MDVSNELSFARACSGTADALADRDGLAGDLAVEWPQDQLTSIPSVQHVETCPVDTP